MGHHRVLFRQPCLLLAHVVKLALMLLGVAVLAAEGVVTLAVETQEAHLPLALPTDALVCLHYIKGG